MTLILTRYLIAILLHFCFVFFSSPFKSQNFCWCFEMQKLWRQSNRGRPLSYCSQPKYHFQGEPKAIKVSSSSNIRGRDRINGLLNLADVRPTVIELILGGHRYEPESSRHFHRRNNLESRNVSLRSRREIHVFYLLFQAQPLFSWYVAVRKNWT